LSGNKSDTEKIQVRYRIHQVLRSLENPIFLSKRFSWLYWKVYNFSWQSWYRVFENPLANSSILASGVGYFIYLNDFIAGRFGFNFVTNETASVLGIDLRQKLYFIYFGLMAIAFSRLIYLWRRPWAIRCGPSLSQWVSYGLSEFTFRDFQALDSEINHHGHRTLYGKYYSDDWDAFKEDATWSESGRTAGFDSNAKRESRQHVGFARAKETHEDLLRSILIDRYEESAARHKISLFFSLILAAIGYTLFLLPNLDLTLTIILSI